jgi:hypothetical protein
MKCQRCEKDDGKDLRYKLKWTMFGKLLYPPLQSYEKLGEIEMDICGECSEQLVKVKYADKNE